VLGRASVIAVFVTRTYAIWNRSRLVLVGLGALGVACIVLDALHVPGLKCKGSSSSQIRATLLSVMVCVVELAAAALTVYHAIKSPLARGPGSQQSFSKFVIRQGVLYFCGASIFTFTAMILNFVAKPDDVLIKLINALTLPFSCLLTSRFLLHLRSFMESRVLVSTIRGQTQSVVSSLNFGVVEEFAQSGTTTMIREDEEDGGSGVGELEGDVTSHRSNGPISIEVASSSR